MKYLKTFEANIYKDYLVWKVEVVNLPQYYLFKLDRTTPTSVFLDGIYSFTSDNNYEKHNLNVLQPLRYSHDQVKQFTVFKSNDLSECEQYIERELTSNKYNL